MLKHAHRADLHLFRKLAATDVPSLDKTLVPLTRAATYSVLWMVMSGLLALFGGRPGRRAALRGMLSIGITSAVANLPMKVVMRRKRPSHKVPRPRRLAIPKSYSFPSGHTASAFAFLSGASAEMPRMAAPLGVLATGVGVSRVYTGAHYPTDVMAGALIGTLFGRLTKRFWPVAPNEVAHMRAHLTPIGTQPSERGQGLSIVVNQSAGPALSRDPADQLQEELPEAEILVMSDELDLDDALKKASSAAKAIGIAGGDGTVNAGAAVAAAQGKPLVLIPAGTLNHLARDLGLMGIEDAVKAVRDGSTVAVDIGLIDDNVFLNTASFGAYADLVDAREKLESKIGKWPAMIIAAVKVLREAEALDIELNGTRRKIWMIFIGNCRYHPAGFAPAWRQELDDGLFDLRLVSADLPWARTRLITAVLTGTLAKSGVYEHSLEGSIHVKSLNGDLRLARDGETFDGSSEVTISKGRDPLAIYAPIPTLSD